MIIQISTWNWELIIAMAGALAWIPWVYEKFTPAKIYGNLISTLTNQGSFNTGEKKINGVLHFLKISVSCINKNFNIKNIEIQVKYENDVNWYSAKIYWARTSVWTMPGIIEVKKLEIPSTHFLGFTNILEKDKSNFYYLTFITEKQELVEFETIRLNFHNYKQQTEIIEFNKKDIDPNRILWENEIWK